MLQKAKARSFSVREVNSILIQAQERAFSDVASCTEEAGDGRLEKSLEESMYLRAIAYHCSLEAAPLLVSPSFPGALSVEDFLHVATDCVESCGSGAEVTDLLIRRLDLRGSYISASTAGSALDLLRLAILVNGSNEPEAGHSTKLLMDLREEDAEHLASRVFILNRVLQEDPSGSYEALVFESKKEYWQAIEKIALESAAHPEIVAKSSVALAKDFQDQSQGHIGYFLLGPGVCEIERELRGGRGSRPSLSNSLKISKTVSARSRCLFYITGSLTICVAASILFMHVSGFGTILGGGILYAISLVLVMFALSDVSVTAAIGVISLRLKRRVLLALKPGSLNMVGDCVAVCIPTLLISESQVDEIISRMEQIYRKAGVADSIIVLLTDHIDSKVPGVSDSERALLERCKMGVAKLNEGWARTGSPTPFLLLHREREYCVTQKMWIGRERKRGKIEDFNHFVCTGERRFHELQGDIGCLHKVRFVLALDDDSDIDRESFMKMLGSMLHPLSKPVLNENGRVVSGSAMVIADWAIRKDSADSWRFGEIFTGPILHSSDSVDSGERLIKVGPHTYLVRQKKSESRAARIIRKSGLGCPLTQRVPPTGDGGEFFYDLLGVRPYNGKGLYDVRAFHSSIGNRFPDDRVLSHDTLEGSWLRPAHCASALLTEDMPGDYFKLSDRQHRWLRGDWQNFMLLLFESDKVLSRGHDRFEMLMAWFHTLGYVRRAIAPIAIFAIFLVAMFASAEQSNKLVIATLTLMLVPTYLLVLAVVISKLVPRVGHFMADTLRRRLMFPNKPFVRGLVESHCKELLRLVMLPHVSFVSIDAMCRSVIRYFTKQKLLEWKSSAMSEQSGASSGVSKTYMRMVLPCVVFLAFLALHFNSGGGAFFVLASWALAPAMSEFVSRKS